MSKKVRCGTTWIQEDIDSTGKRTLIHNCGFANADSYVLLAFPQNVRNFITRIQNIDGNRTSVTASWLSNGAIENNNESTLVNWIAIGK